MRIKESIDVKSRHEPKHVRTPETFLDSGHYNFLGRTAQALCSVGFKNLTHSWGEKSSYNNVPKTQSHSQNQEDKNSTPRQLSEALSQSVGESSKSEFVEEEESFSRDSVKRINSLNEEKKNGGNREEVVNSRKSEEGECLCSTFEESLETQSLVKDIGTSPVGIDKIWLFGYLEPGQVRSDNKLKIFTKGESYENRLLFVDDNGECIDGKEAVWKDEDIYMKIKPLKGYDSSRLHNPNKGQCHVQFSVARLCGWGDNTNPVSLEESVAAFSEVERRLASMGIRVNLREFSVVGMELFRNLTMDVDRASSSLDVVKTFAPSHAKKHKYQTGVLNRNKSRSRSVYDKDVEREYRGLEVENSAQSILRFETRLKKGEVVRRSLGIRTVQDLLDRFEVLHDFYVKDTQKAYFKANLTKFSSARQYPKGRVNQRLTTILKGLSERQIDESWTLRKLHRVLESQEVTGLRTELLETVRGTTTSPYSVKSNEKWVGTRIRALKNAVQGELLLDPEYALLYRALGTCLMGKATTFLSNMPPHPKSDETLSAMVVS